MKIADLEIGTFGLAPLAGVTDLGLRTLAREFGADFTVTEMVSARGLLENGEKTAALLARGETEHPIGVQLFGADPFVMSDAARSDLLAPFDWIDINMGCPVPKVTKTGAGCALSRTVDRAASLVACVKRACAKPVTAKIRLGWDEAHENYIELGRALRDAGADGICLHARTRAQGYAGAADWRAIAALREALSIPVIANGDIVDRESFAACRAATGCEAYLIGRGAVGRPWIFSELKGRDVEIDLPAVVRRHARILCEQYGERYAVVNMRHHIGCYLRGRVGAASMRARVNACGSMDELYALIDGIRP